MTCLDFQSIEERRLADYIARSTDERPCPVWISQIREAPSIIIAEGFEERSLGVLERLATSGVTVPSAILGRYVDNTQLNAAYRERFEKALQVVAPNRWQVVDNHNDGKWVRECLDSIPTASILLDITGISNRGLFEAIDPLAECEKTVFLGYTEAKQYWPKQKVWERLKRDLHDNASLADTVDREPWLFGYEHRVELVPGHEGYDSAGSGRALIGFLPFKRARLAAILGEWEYESFLFIAGRPRLPENQWRLDVLKEINASLIRSWPVAEMSTFGYRDALRQFSSTLFSDHCLLHKYDVHLAILGSKLQNLACWAASRILPSLTVVTSVPQRYYPDAFSDGIGMSWVVEMLAP